jgi:hypothetical protein
LLFFKVDGQVEVDEKRVDGRAGRGRGDVGFAAWVGEGDTTAVVDLACRGGMYPPQVGAGGAAASTGPLLTGWGLACFFSVPPPSVTNPVIIRAATTAATIPVPSP